MAHACELPFVPIILFEELLARSMWLWAMTEGDSLPDGKEGVITQYIVMMLKEIIEAIPCFSSLLVKTITEPTDMYSVPVHSSNAALYLSLGDLACVREITPDIWAIRNQNMISFFVVEVKRPNIFENNENLLRIYGQMFDDVGR